MHLYLLSTFTFLILRWPHCVGVFLSLSLFSFWDDLIVLISFWSLLLILGVTWIYQCPLSLSLFLFWGHPNVGVFSGAGIPQTSSASLPGCPMEQHLREAGLAPHHRPRHHLLVQLEEDRSWGTFLSFQPHHHLFSRLDQVPQRPLREAVIFLFFFRNIS